MLDTLLPVTLILGAIDPVHFSISVPSILDIAAYVIVTTFPVELSVPMFFVVEIVTRVLVAFWIRFLLFPFAFTVFHSLLEFAYVLSTGLPFVDAVTIRFAIQILPGVLVLVCEVVCTLTILERSRPLSLVLVAVCPLMYSISPDFVVTPLTHVRVIEEAFPDTEAVFAALDPFTVVRFSMVPSIMTFPVRLVVHECSFVDVTGLISFVALTIPFVGEPLSFIDPPVLGSQHSEAFSMSLGNVQLPSIGGSLVPLNNKVFLISQSLIIKYVRDHFVFGGDRVLIILLRVLSFRRFWQLKQRLLFFFLLLFFWTVDSWFLVSLSFEFRVTNFIYLSSAHDFS